MAKGSKIWHLKVLPGQIRAGKLYSVVSVHRHVDCTCPDSVQTHAVCKHIRALQVLGVIAKSARPSIMVAWDVVQKTRRAEAAAAASPVSPPSPVTAKTRRRHTPVTQVNDASQFAAGWNDAVRLHVAGLSQTGGVS